MIEGQPPKHLQIYYEGRGLFGVIFGGYTGIPNKGYTKDNSTLWVEDYSNYKTGKFWVTEKVNEEEYNENNLSKN